MPLDSRLNSPTGILCFQSVNFGVSAIVLVYKIFHAVNIFCCFVHT